MQQVGAAHTRHVMYRYMGAYYISFIDISSIIASHIRTASRLRYRYDTISSSACIGDQIDTHMMLMRRMLDALHVDMCVESTYIVISYCISPMVLVASTRVYRHHVISSSTCIGDHISINMNVVRHQIVMAHIDICIESMQCRIVVFSLLACHTRRIDVHIRA